MAKYKTGDKFIATITRVDDTGMGTTYEFNNGMITTKEVIDHMMPYQEPSETPENGQNKLKAREYTLDELRSRIFRLSKILSETIGKYEEMRTGINAAVDRADKELGGD